MLRAQVLHRRGAAVTSPGRTHRPTHLVPAAPCGDAFPGPGARLRGTRSLINLLTERLPPGRLLTGALWLNVYLAIYACAIFSPLEKEENRFLKMLPTLRMNSYFPAP